MMKGAQQYFFEMFVPAPTSNNSRTVPAGTFSSAAFRVSEHCLITVNTQARYFRNSRKTSTLPLSAVAKSRFLAI